MLSNDKEKNKSEHSLAKEAFLKLLTISFFRLFFQQCYLKTILLNVIFPPKRCL